MLLLTTSCRANLSEQNKKMWLDYHNYARYMDDVEQLVWSEKLSEHAQEWATYLARNGCILKHSSGSGYGENLAAYFGDNPKTPGDIVNLWVEEKKNYHYPSNSCAPDKMCGHYTQVVWSGTTEVGCGQARGTSGGTQCYVYSCSYNPPGNYVGQWPY